jgi:tripartite-type tricarboxylate transporter receptor subunit TctC
MGGVIPSSGADMRCKLRCAAVVVIFLGIPGAAGFALAQQNYPAKPIRVIVPFGPGGPTDFLVRTVGQKMAESWGQQLVVDHRTGANGVVGLELAARSAPDGYTLAMATNGTHGINASLYPKLPYDTVKDFAPVTRIGLAPYVLIAHPSLPVRTVKELIALARTRAGEITWSCGGSPSQLAAELFKKTAAINVIVVPYKGNAPAVTAVISGEVSLSFGNIAQSVPQIKAGRLRALGVGSLRRSSVLPDVPTVAETGLPGFEAGAWYGVLAPAATPRAIVERLNGELVRISRLPDVQQRLRGEAYDVIADSPDQFAAAIRAEIAKWAPIVKQAGLRAE